MVLNSEMGERFFFPKRLRERVDTRVAARGVSCALCCLSVPPRRNPRLFPGNSILRKDLALHGNSAVHAHGRKMEGALEYESGKNGKLNTSMWCISSTVWEENFSGTWGFTLHLFPTAKSSSPGTPGLLSGLLWKSIPDVPAVKRPYPNTTSIWNVHHFNE